MPQCAFKKCKNHTSRTKKKDGISYFRFPRDPEQRAKWMSIIVRQRPVKFYQLNPSSVVCAKHFLESDMYVTNKGMHRLKKTAVPQVDEDSLPPEPDEDRHEKEIKVFCPKCNSEICHTAEGIQLDQTKIIVAKVYHYFEQEYEELKKTIEEIDQTPLSMFRQRTALATGVSETTVLEILEEEARRNEEMRQEILREQSLARKRPRQTDSSSEDGDSDDNNDFDEEQPSAVDETETLVIKEEPVEPYNEEPEVYVEMPNVKEEPGVSADNQEMTDPISIDLKTEPRTEEATTSNETPAAKRASKSKVRKIQRNTDTPPATYGSPAAPASPATSVPPTTSAPPRRQMILLEHGEVKMEQIEIDEEGFS